MREIKFRAYADGKIFNNVGVVGNIIVLEYDSCEDDYGVDLELNYYGLNDDSIKLMQFTGLHDKNGKEIYEGDIVNSTDTTGLHKYDKDVIEFQNGGFVLVNTDENIDDAWIGDDDFGELEVIGNIYENPELLKEEVK